MVLDLVAHGPGMVRLYLPDAVVGPRVRQRILLLAAAESPTAAGLLEGWSAYLGEVELAETDEAILAFASELMRGASAATDYLSAEEAAATRASVALGGVLGRVGGAADRLLACTRERRLGPPAQMVSDVWVAAIGAPVVLPLAGMAAALGAIARVAPAMPVVELPDRDDANLLTQLVAESLPSLLANALLRSVVLGLPGGLAVGLRTGASESTVVIGDGRVLVANGIAPTAIAVLEGDIAPLLRAAVVRMARELKGLRVR